MIEYQMTDAIKRLCILAQTWQNASHNDAFGMGAGSRMMADAHDRARANFERALFETRTPEIADALAELLRRPVSAHNDG